ncbi:FAD dependent oxidoreductase [Gemmatirosa kalamazoonensis]|uniref:FAD dependent oxidoreductase n=1 Tax=Gemmatirosa kalamazoonensis TaxID=861299 RepID=W0RG25_9BACT|nr:FAD-dependent oxidoreductase [Gemmatirosa kalamazoonensis]AHG89275.1 FAD dependent oxidoreductase [Gemmatirosa kalamazoonensis]
MPLARASAAEHVVVVGAGAFGGWTALALRRAGLRVTLVDAWGAGNARASSGGETRVIRAVYNGQAAYSAMAARALVLWRDAERAWGRRVLHRTGALWLCASDDAYVRRSIEPMRAVGLSVEELSPGEAARRWPQMAFGDARTVFHEPAAGFLAARVACELVRETFVREGGAYRQGWARPGAATHGRLPNVTLGDGGTLAADRFVFACGPWMGQVFPDVVGRRIVATRQESFFFGTPAGDARYDAGALPVWVHLGERLIYGVASHDRRGLKIADDTAGDEIDPTTMERAPSADGLARARAALAARFPALAGAPLVESRVCQYEASSDGHFLADRHPELENVWLLGGGSGHGFKMGPALGEHAAALVRGRASAHPLFAYARLRERPAAR